MPGQHANHLSDDHATLTTLDTMPGNALLALTGVKTLYVGYPQPAQPGQFAWLTSTVKVDETGTSKTVRVPVIIDRVDASAPRAALTTEEWKAAGYADEQGYKKRMESAAQYKQRTAPNYLQQMVTQVGTADPLTVDQQRDLFMETAPASRIHFHLATPEELKTLAANGSKAPSVNEAYAAVRDAITDLRAGEQLGRKNVVDAVAFAQSQGVDLTRAKLAAEARFKDELSLGRSAA